MTEIVLHLSSGQGPRECEWVVWHLVRVWGEEARQAGLSCEPVEPVPGPAASVLLSLSGPGAAAFAAARLGTVRWIGTSPFRPHHKRRNWFVSARPAPTAEDVPELRDEDLRFETLRASGPGGQHVNKTESAVRVTHTPTGLTAFSQEQRSQLANRKVARMKLAMLLEERRERNAATGNRQLWAQNHDLERGNAVRSYAGETFVLK